MNWKMSVVVALAGLMLLATPGAADEAVSFGELGRVTVVDKDRNPVALELMGKWVPDTETAALLGLPQNRRSWYSEIEFKKDTDAGKSFLEYLGKLAADTTRQDLKRALQAVYLNGVMRVNVGKESWGDLAFVLVDWCGASAIIHQTADGKHGIHRISLVRDVGGHNDMLFFASASGADSPDATMYPMQRDLDC